MTQNLKIEVLTGDISIDGKVVTNLVTKEELSTAIVKKADLGTDGKIPTSQLPAEIVNTVGIVDEVKLQLETSIKDAVDESNAYAESYTDNALTSKADLTSGKVSLEQLPAIDQYPQFDTALSNLSTSILTSVKQRTDQLEKSKADLGEDGKVLREQIPSYEKISGLPEQLELMSTQTAAVSKELGEHKVQTAELIDALEENIEANVQQLTERQSYLMRTYASKELGVDDNVGVKSSEYFYVRSTNEEEMFVEYQNIGGVPTPSGKSYPSAAYVQNIAKHTALPFVDGKTYDLNERVQLENGDIVKSTVANNIVNPNANITGWFSFENYTKTYIDNFPYYLKFDSSIGDYSPIIQNLIESGVRIQLTTDAVYPCLTPIVISSLSKSLYIDGHGALLSYVGAYTNRFITIKHSIPLNHVINSFYIDVNRNASSCFCLESSQNNEDGESNFFASQFGASNCFKQTSNENGNIVEIRGAFKSVKFISPKIENIELGTGAGVSQIQGVTGLAVLRLNNESYTRVLELQSPQISKVFSEDIDYTDDQDGIRFFTGASSKFNRKNKSKFLCYGGVFSKCWGRSIKTQCGYTLVSGGSFDRDEGNSTKSGNNEISVQHGNGSVSGCSFYYSNGYKSTCVSFDTGATYNCSGGSVRDCEVFLDDETTLAAFISNQPRDGGGSQTIIADGNKVHGKAELFSRFRVSGLNNEFIVNNNMVEEIVAVDHFGTGLNKVFNVALGMGVSPRSGLLTMNHNSVIYSDNDVALSLDNISGQAIGLPVSSQGNFGFDQNPKGNVDRNGLKVKQVNKADGYGRANYRTYTTTLSQSLSGGATYDFQSEGIDGGMIFIGLSRLNLSQCIISVSAGSIRVLQSHNTEDNLQVYFNNNQPSTPQGLLLDIWRHPDQDGKIVIRNNNSSTRELNIFQIVM